MRAILGDDLLNPFYPFVPGLAVFAWLPLFGLSMLLLRVVGPLLTLIEKMQWFLKDGKDHPLEAVGYVASVAVFVGAAVWQFAFKTAS
jgi:hypothetical protein